MSPGTSFTCPRCGARSHHPDDVDQGYCGRCHDWTAPRAAERMMLGGLLAEIRDMDDGQLLFFLGCIAPHAGPALIRSALAAARRYMPDPVPAR